MSTRLPDALTPVPVDELLAVYHAVWLNVLRGTPPPVAALEIITAQWAIETGWGKSCHCWNLGNAKAKVGGAYDWTFFTCGEELPEKTARAEAARDQRVTIVRQYTTGGRAMASVRIVPEHPWCCFRAFPSLTEGATDHLVLLHRRFPDAFDAAQRGDATGFASALKRAGYYTASVESYTKGLLGCLPRVHDMATRINWDECPRLSDWQVERVEGILALSASLTDADWTDMRRDRDAALREPDE